MNIDETQTFFDFQAGADGVELVVVLEPAGLNKLMMNNR